MYSSSPPHNKVRIVLLILVMGEVTYFLFSILGGSICGTPPLLLAMEDIVYSLSPILQVGHLLHCEDEGSVHTFCYIGTKHSGGV